jgi:type I restriction enzyme S subunit
VTAAFDRVRLGDVARIRHGFAFEGAYFVDRPTKYVLLTPGNFHVGGGFKSDKLKFYDGPVPAEYMLSPGALVVTMTDLSKNMDTLGYPALVPELPDGRIALHNQRIGLVEVTSSSVDKYWLFYRLRGADYRSEVLASSSGTTVHHTSPSRIERFEFVLPPLEEQRAIAATLGALDDKIESNRRTIALIPQLVRARVDASLSQASDRIAVAELARFVNGGAYTKGATGTGRMVIRIAELNSGPGGSTVYNDIDVPDEKVARAGDILMSWSGSLGVYRWFRDEAIVNQHIFKVIPTGYPAWLVFDRLDAVMPIFRGVAADKATTMGHIQRGHLESTNVEIPVVSEIEQLNEMLSPLWGRLLSAEREVVRLTKLRDALLPELLSGRMRVPAEGVAA